MNIYRISNKKYNINFDLKLDSYHIFIESLKESRKYYHDYCNLENINIKDFDIEYIDNINILKSDLLKYYILITNDDDVEKYVIIDDTIRDMYNSVMKVPSLSHRGRHFTRNENIVVFNINYLNRQKLLILVHDYLFIGRIYDYFNIINEDNIINRNNLWNMWNNINLRIKYVDSLSYKTIYERELDKILYNLPNICLSNISSKKLLNCNNNINLIDLDNDEEFFDIEVD